MGNCGKKNLGDFNNNPKLKYKLAFLWQKNVGLKKDVIASVVKRSPSNSSG